MGGKDTERREGKGRQRRSKTQRDKRVTSQYICLLVSKEFAAVFYVEFMCKLNLLYGLEQDTTLSRPLHLIQLYVLANTHVSRASAAYRDATK